MEKSIYKYVLRFSLKQQIILIVMSAVTLPFLYAFYELPKYIINQIIQIPEGNWEALKFGVEIEQVPFLIVMSGLFLVLILLNQGFKYIINVYRGITGERMLRRLRFELYRRILRFPIPTFRRVTQGETIAMITAEVEPLGGFVAEAYSLPAFQGGTMLVIGAFLFVQNWVMALAAIALYPIQFYLIPKLQRKVNELGKERVRRVRRLSDRIGETVQGVQEIHAHDTSHFEMAEFSRQLGGIYDVRYRIYVQKFVIKFLNNTIQQLGPFFFYAIGGYLTIKGELDIGTLMAAIAAHKDLGAPWKELLGYYQRFQDARIKYEQVVSQFAPAGMLSEEMQDAEPDPEQPLANEIAATNLTLIDDQGTNIIDGSSFTVPTDRRIAIVGPAGSGREDLALLLARLIQPDRGSINVGGHDLGAAPEGFTGRRLSYVGPSAFIFNTSLAQNLFYGLKHRPLTPAQYEDEDEQAEHRKMVAESTASGNATDDVNADWIDYAAADAGNGEDLTQKALAALDMVDMSTDVYQFGLRGTIDPQKRGDLANDIMAARERLRERLTDPEMADLVEIFDAEKYNSNASVAENLLFGNPVGSEFDLERLAENAYVQQVLDQAGLTERFLDVGYQVASTMVELFADLPPDHELFQQYSFISAEELPDVQAMLQRTDKDNLASLNDEDRLRLMSLPFKLIHARHRLGLMEDLQEPLLAARKAFADNLPEELSSAVEFFEVSKYNSSANLLDNILFGKVAYGQAQAQERVGDLIREVIDELGIRDTVAEVGLNFEVGVAGSRLSGTQRQKLALARALLKRPDVLIVSDATASLDSQSQARIMAAVLDHFVGRGLFWAVHQVEMARQFDWVIVMRHGQVVETGETEKLLTGGGALQELIENGG